MASAPHTAKYGCIPAEYPKPPQGVFEASPGERVFVRMRAGPGAEEGCSCCPCAACGAPDTGIVQEERESIPPPLERAGVTQQQYQGWIEDYAETVDVHAKCTCLELVLLLTVICIPVVLIMDCCGCSQSGTRRYQEAARAWQERVNETLKPPLFAKTQVILHGQLSGDGKQNETRHYPWLSVALTAAEADRLRKEPHAVKTSMVGDCCACMPAHEADMVV